MTTGYGPRFASIANFAIDVSDSSLSSKILFTCLDTPLLSTSNYFSDLFLTF